MAANYAVWNGWKIVPHPTYPSFRQMDFHMTDKVSGKPSIFNGQQQLQVWQGGDQWSVDVSLPPMTREVAAGWRAWLMALRGRANVFQLGDPLHESPMGMPSGTPVVNGAHSAGETTLRTSGWTPSLSQHLVPGDYIQIGYRLYAVAGTETVDSDSNGEATIEIWPSLRDAPPNKQLLLLQNTSGLFRLSENTRTWSVSEIAYYGISFKCEEAK